MILTGRKIRAAAGMWAYARSRRPIMCRSPIRRPAWCCWSRQG